jgi:hypothetical protein
MRAHLRCFGAAATTRSHLARLISRFDGARFRDAVDSWITWIYRVTMKTLGVAVAVSMMVDVIQGNLPAAEDLRLIAEILM